MKLFISSLLIFLIGCNYTPDMQNEIPINLLDSSKIEFPLLQKDTNSKIAINRDTHTQILSIGNSVWKAKAKKFPNIKNVIKLNDTNKFAIYVDTNQIVSGRYQTGFISEDPLTSKYIEVRHFPLFLVNLSNEIEKIEVQDGNLNKIQEVKVDSNRWMPIEKWHYSWCGNSYYLTSINKYGFQLYAVNKYIESIKMECRTRVEIQDQIYYSNIYYNYISKEQLEELQQME